MKKRKGYDLGLTVIQFPKPNFLVLTSALGVSRQMRIELVNTPFVSISNFGFDSSRPRFGP